MCSTEMPRRGAAGPSPTERSLATTLPLVAFVVLVSLALTESFDAFVAAVVAFASASLILRGD